jgi:tetratricopeptide (TPR) repeat protein
MPPLPKIDTAGFQPAVRQAIQDALQSAERNAKSPEASAAAGKTLHAHDQFRAAVDCYRRAHVLDPARFDFLYYEAAALCSCGKFSEAIEPLRQALSIDSSRIPARLKLGDALLAAGRTEEARDAFRGVIARNPSVAAAHYGLGKTLEGEEAAAEFRKALELFPRFGAAQFALAAVYRKAGRTGEADQTLIGYEQNKTAAPPLDDPLMDEVYARNAGANGLLRRAHAAESRGQLAEAADLCERAVETDPKLDQARVDLISLYGRLGRTEKLEKAYAEVARLAPDRADAHYNYGVYCAQSRRIEEARRAFERTVALDPRHADAWNNLGAIVEQMGAMAQAADCFRRAIAARSGFPRAHFHLGRIYANQRRYADAIRELARSLEPKSDETPTYSYALAATYARAGQRQRSVELMREAREAAARLGQSGLIDSIDRDLRAMGASR